MLSEDANKTYIDIGNEHKDAIIDFSDKSSNGAGRALSIVKIVLNDLPNLGGHLENVKK